MQKIIDMLLPMAAALDQAVSSGHIKGLLIILAAAALGIFLAGAIAAAALSRRHERDMDSLVVQHARRVALFYLDRPLRAEVTLEYKTCRDRSDAMKQDWPECSIYSLEKAVWEAEYNEFVAWELENELHAMRRDFSDAGRRQLKLAAKEIAGAKRKLPHGVTAVFLAKHGFRKELLYKLEYAHKWLDVARDDPRAMPSGEKYKALRANRFRCAWCGSDWNDGAHLEIVKTKSGALVPACSKCMSAHVQGAAE